jgi:flavin reductase (DIM6/NTAB) family NADH-FMN oxidoreductase RutF
MTGERPAADAFTELMTGIDPPMSVVTTAARHEHAGCLVGFQAQCSIDPHRYAVWLSKANHTCRVALHAEHLAVHLLGLDDLDIAELFGTVSGDDVDKFTRCSWRPGPTGVPLLERVPDRVVLARQTTLDEGSDHLCFIGEVVDATTSGRFSPLRLSAVEHLHAGHGAGERPQPPTERAR